MKTYKKGISLIVLVVTIIVLAILATTVIIALSGDNGNIISEGKEAVFKSNVISYQDELNMYIASQFPVNKTTDINATGSAMTAIIPSMKAEDVAKFEIANGKLKYVGIDATEKQVAIEMGIYEMTEGEKYNAKYATEIANALSVGEVTGTTYTLTADPMPSNIKSIAIPYGCTTMDNYYREQYIDPGDYNLAYPLRDLQTLVIPGSMTTIPSNVAAFVGPSQIIICEGVTTLGDYAFEYIPALKTLYLPSTLTTVGAYNFSDVNELENVYYGGTEEQWENLNISFNDAIVGEEIEFNLHLNYKY